MDKTTTKPERILNRKVLFKKTFLVPDSAFGSLSAAEAWLKQYGYQYGSLDHPNTTIAVVIGEYELPQKWHNMSAAGRKMVDGIIEFKRGSAATVYLFNLSEPLKQSDERI